MKDLDALLQTVADGMKTMADGIESLAKKLEILAKAQRGEKATRKRKSAIKPRKKAAGKKPAKKAVLKKEKPITAVDAVYRIIKRSGKGVDTETLMAKTGYNPKKIANMVFKLKKQGKIKSVRKGVYVTV